MQNCTKPVTRVSTSFDKENHLQTREERDVVLVEVLSYITSTVLYNPQIIILVRFYKRRGPLVTYSYKFKKIARNLGEVEMILIKPPLSLSSRESLPS